MGLGEVLLDCALQEKEKLKNKENESTLQALSLEQVVVPEALLKPSAV